MSVNKVPLTKRQAEVFAFMVEYFHRNDQLPPVSALVEHFEFAKFSVVRHRDQLEMRGYIERNESGKYRFTRDRALQTTKFKPDGWKKSLAGNVIPTLPQRHEVTA